MVDVTDSAILPWRGSMLASTDCNESKIRSAKPTDIIATKGEGSGRLVRTEDREGEAAEGHWR